MNILIDNKSGEPIYNQIYSQIKNQIISGALEEDTMLPSIRGLAKDLRISFITTKRAYEELEKEGFIYTLPGKGCYVAPKNIELLRDKCFHMLCRKEENISVTLIFLDSSVYRVCPVCKKAVRVAHRIEDGKNVRFCKKCNATLDVQKKAVKNSKKA